MREWAAELVDRARSEGVELTGDNGLLTALVRQGQRRLDGLTGNIISLYAKGMTTGDIQAHLLEIYGTEVSRDTSAGPRTLAQQREEARSVEGGDVAP